MNTEDFHPLFLILYHNTFLFKIEKFIYLSKHQ